MSVCMEEERHAEDESERGGEKKEVKDIEAKTSKGNYFCLFLRTHDMNLLEEVETKRRGLRVSGYMFTISYTIVITILIIGFNVYLTFSRLCEIFSTLSTPLFVVFSLK